MIIRQRQQLDEPASVALDLRDEWAIDAIIDEHAHALMDSALAAPFAFLASVDGCGRDDTAELRLRALEIILAAVAVLNEPAAFFTAEERIAKAVAKVEAALLPCARLVAESTRERVTETYLREH